jgi:hypothetical protein
MIIFISPYAANVSSIFVSNADLGGSSFEMRISQLHSAIQIFENKLFFGLGIKSLDRYLGITTGILGAESIWIRLIIERGLFGILSYLFLMGSIILSNIKTKKYSSLFFTVGWLVLNSITSIPGSGFWFYGLLYIIIIRCDEISRSQIA